MLTALLSTLATLTTGLLRAGLFACPLCGKAMANDGQQGLLQGIAWSWILLAGLPLLLVAAFVTVLVRTYRKSQLPPPPQK